MRSLIYWELMLQFGDRVLRSFCYLCDRVGWKEEQRMAKCMPLVFFIAKVECHFYGNARLIVGSSAKRYM